MAFVCLNREWNLETILEASDAGSYDYFGDSVSISGNYIIIGSTGYDVWNFNQRIIESSAGGAYIFERNINTNKWDQVSILTCSK